jgi:hypothetical protein
VSNPARRRYLVDRPVERIVGLQSGGFRVCVYPYHSQNGYL